MDLNSASHVRISIERISGNETADWSCTQNFDSYFQIIFPKQPFSLKKKKKKKLLWLQKVMFLGEKM